MKNIIILGSSGSIGKSTLSVVRNFPDLFKVTALSVHRNIDILISQIKEFQPKVVIVTDQAAGEKIKLLIPSGIKLFIGDAGLLEAASSCEYDIFVGAMVGFAGLVPTVEAIKRGKRIALANKETLVVAGKLITDLCKEHDAELIPVDSEHSAIFQCLMGENIAEVNKIILTASGGPFFTKSRQELNKVTIEQALSHPTWKMGSKITIDSATLMNKGLEVIEAHWLFNLPPGKIEIVIHPQSIIHSMVEFVDGSIKAQLSVPDMKIPIQLALTYPNRLPAQYVTTNFPSLGTLSFYKPDYNKFECLKLAYRVLEEGGTTPCVLNASNEVAVAKFLRGDIGFLKIPEIIHRSLEKIKNNPYPCLEEIVDCDHHTRVLAEQLN